MSTETVNLFKIVYKIGGSITENTFATGAQVTISFNQIYQLTKSVRRGKIE